MFHPSVSDGFDDGPNKKDNKEELKILRKVIEDYKWVLQTFCDAPILVIQQPGCLRSIPPSEETLKWAQEVIVKDKNGQYTVKTHQEELDVVNELYGNLKMEVGNWIEFKEGKAIPDYDEYVLWAFEDGTCIWDALDKDGNPHIYGGEYQGFTFKRATHWRKIMTPIECDEVFNIK